MLAKLQKEFWSALTDSDDAVVASICNDGRLDASDRLEIYRTNVRSLHVSVLMSVYPVCEKILGSDYFKQIAVKYFKQNPSRSVDLNEYGELFADFLQQLSQQRPELTDYPYLADLAQLEWQIQKVYFAADNVKLDVLEFQKTYANNPGEIKFSLQEGMSILESEFPIAELWEVHQADSETFVSDMVNQHEYLCVFRNEYQVSIKKINVDMFRLISLMKNEKKLSEIADAYVDSQRLNAALAQLIKNEWLRQCYV